MKAVIWGQMLSWLGSYVLGMDVCLPLLFILAQVINRQVFYSDVAQSCVFLAYIELVL